MNSIKILIICALLSGCKSALLPKNCFEKKFRNISYTSAPGLVSPIISAKENLSNMHLLKGFISDTSKNNLILTDTLQVNEFFYPNNQFYYATYKSLDSTSTSSTYTFLIGSNASRYDSLWRASFNKVTHKDDMMLISFYPLSDNLKFRQHVDHAVWYRLYAMPTNMKYNKGRHFVRRALRKGNKEGRKFIKLTKSGKYRNHMLLNLRQMLFGWDSLKEEWPLILNKKDGKAIRKRLINKNNLNEAIYTSYFGLILKEDFGEINLTSYSKGLFYDKIKFSSETTSEKYLLKFNKYYPFCYTIKEK